MVDSVFRKILGEKAAKLHKMDSAGFFVGALSTAIFRALWRVCRRD